MSKRVERVTRVDARPQRQRFSGCSPSSVTLGVTSEGGQCLEGAVTALRNDPIVNAVKIAMRDRGHILDAAGAGLNSNVGHGYDASICVPSQLAKGCVSALSSPIDQR